MADWSPYIDAEGLDRLEFEALAPVYEDALRRDPDDLDALVWLGHAYTRLGRIADGLAVDLRLTALLPDDPTARYNLACSYALSGRPDDAFATLDHAARLGYREVEHIRQDEDLAPLRADPRFAAFLERLTRGPA